MKHTLTASLMMAALGVPGTASAQELDPLSSSLLYFGLGKAALTTTALGCNLAVSHEQDEKRDYRDKHTTCMITSLWPGTIVLIAGGFSIWGVTQPAPLKKKQDPEQRPPPNGGVGAS